MLAGLFDPDGLSIGTYDRVAEDWVDGAMLLGSIRVSDARAVELDVLGMTLCGLISGDTAESDVMDDDCQGDPNLWPHPPDTTVGDEPAWRFTASFSASPVRILGD